MSTRDTSAEVATLVRQTLALPETEPIAPQQLFFYDLGFTSMDLLDLLFRIEQHFQIEIPEGTIYHLARGDLAEAEFAEDAVLTEAGRAASDELCFTTRRKSYFRHAFMRRRCPASARSAQSCDSWTTNSRQQTCSS